VRRIDRNIEDRAVNMKHSRVLTSEDDIGIGDSQDKMATKSQNIKELMNRSRSVFVGQLSSELDNVGLRKYFEE
jgi:predicted GTPase